MTFIGGGALRAPAPSTGGKLAELKEGGLDDGGGAVGAERRADVGLAFGMVWVMVGTELVEEGVGALE